MNLILGLDPGFANIGFAMTSTSGSEVKAIGLISTEKSNKKQKVRASDDNALRTREIVRALNMLKVYGNIVAICAESMSFPRSSSVSAKMALSWGAIIAFAVLNSEIPIVQSTPQEIKRAVCGKKSASKEEVQAALVARYRDQYLVEKLDGIAHSMHEHPFDALGSIVAGFESDTLQLLRRLG